MKEIEFLKHFASNHSQIMWFLGAGTSRSAGMPTATDIIWDLKIRLYCLLENQDIKGHDANNDAVRKKVQDYFDNLGYPPLWHPDEYSFYFEKSFGNDYDRQQKYLSEKLNSRNISLNAGHKILAALLTWQKAKLVFTTNFDEVIETAYARVADRSLPTFHLEGSYAALNALNQEQFPIYAKIHGDFKFRSVKNLAPDLLENDKQIQNCFHAAASRYGLVITGYSGRDQNVMSMLKEAIGLHNAFPMGLFWAVTDKTAISSAATDLIQEAQKLGINAHIVETGTFDIMLSKIWRQLPDKPQALIEKVNASVNKIVSIPLPQPGTHFPILRTNAFPIVSLPSSCAILETKTNFSNSELVNLVKTNRPNAVIAKLEDVLGWGTDENLEKGLGADEILSIKSHQLENPASLVEHSTLYKAFFERALMVAVCNDKPLLTKRKQGIFVAVDPRSHDDAMFAPLRAALSATGGQIIGTLANGTTWQEAVEFKLEVRNGRAWLLLTPNIWIEPLSERRNHKDFLKQRKLKRWNALANSLLDAWVRVLFGAQAKAADVPLIAYTNSNYPAKFIVNTRSAYSKRIR